MMRAALMAVLCLFALPAIALADPVYNSSEPGCDGSDSNVVWCEDFESSDALGLTPFGPGPGVGVWASENCDVANSQGGIDSRTKGWCNSIFPDQGNFPHSYCAPGFGISGSNCVARSVLEAGGNSGNSMNGSHNFGPTPPTGYPRIYLRFYHKRIGPWSFQNNQKMITFNHTKRDNGGIFISGVGDGSNAGGRIACPVWDCNYAGGSYRNPQNPVNSEYLFQNQGNNIVVTNLVDHWIFMEIMIQMNTPFGTRNGLLDVYIDDCGTTGTSCPLTPTLRARYTNVGYQGGGSPNTGPNIGQVALDIWGNPSDGGTWIFDNIRVATVGPIGFAMSVPPPTAPTNLIGCVGVGCTPASVGALSILVLIFAAWRGRRLLGRRA